MAATRDATRRTGNSNRVYSVALDALTGELLGPELLELTLPIRHGTFTQPVADIAFPQNGDMLVAERDMESDFSNDAHRAIVRESFLGADGSALTDNPMRVGAALARATDGSSSLRVTAPMKEGPASAATAGCARFQRAPATPRRRQTASRGEPAAGTARGEGVPSPSGQGAAARSHVGAGGR